MKEIDLYVYGEEFVENWKFKTKEEIIRVRWEEYLETKRIIKEYENK